MDQLTSLIITFTERTLHYRNLDLFTANKSNGSSILLGDGNGGGNVVDNDIVPDMSDVNTGDFNGDGILDLVFNGDTGSGSKLTISLGNGDGTFRSGVAITNGLGVGRYFTADFNLDGSDDIITAKNGSLQLYLSNGDGTFRAGSNLVSDIGIQSYGASIGDFDQDGIEDIAYTGTGGKANVILGNGDGTFKARYSFTTSAAGASTIQAADFNGDGLQDLAIVASSANFEIHLGRGDGTFHTFTSFASNNPSQTISNAVDINGDGITDIYLGTAVHLGNGDGSFKQGVSSLYATSFGDFNNDGALDAVTSVFQTTVSLAVTTPGASSLTSFSLLNKSDARQALSMLTSRSKQLSFQKGQIGSNQSRLEFALSNLQNSSLNFQEAESRIRDVDVATESASLVRLSILQKSAIQILSQAAIQPEIALKLLNTS